MSNSRSSVPVINLFGLLYLKARAIGFSLSSEMLKPLSLKGLTGHQTDSEVKSKIGHGLNTWYTRQATKGPKTGLTPTIYGVGWNKKALVTAVCTCILSTQSSGPDPADWETRKQRVPLHNLILNPWQFPRINKAAALRRLTQYPRHQPRN